MSGFSRKTARQGSGDASRVPEVLLASYSWGATAVVPSADHHAFVIRCLTRVYHNSPERVSFVDCLVMAYARLYDTREIFGFDAVFVQNGYHLPGKAEKQAA
jgi:predicted nucleic acid-binding protein